MAKAMLFPDWRDKVVYGAAGPQQQVLLDDGKVKVVLAGLEPGAMIPPHPEGQGVFYFLEGRGWMTVDGERMEVQEGATMLVPPGVSRGIEAESRLAFLVVRLT